MEVMEGAVPGMPGSASEKLCGRSGRPVPADFADVAPKHSAKKLCTIYRCGRVQLSKWLDATGVSPIPTRPLFKNRQMPEGFAERALEPNRVLKEAFNCRDDQLTRWRKECGLLAETGRGAKKPIPDDFTARHHRHSQRELAAIYRVNQNVIRRWREEAGLKPRAQMFRPAPPTPSAGRDMSIGGRAADFLRRPLGGGWPVHRCTEAGEANRDGDHFRVGTRVMTEDAMLQMAERKGFRAFEDMPRPAPAITSTAVSL